MESTTESSRKSSRDSYVMLGVRDVGFKDIHEPTFVLWL